MTTITKDLPRRIHLNLMTPAEKAIYDAVQEVEKAGAHPLLTDAVILLQQARDKVADYVDREIEKAEFAPGTWLNGDEQMGR